MHFAPASRFPLATAFVRAASALGLTIVPLTFLGCVSHPPAAPPPSAACSPADAPFAKVVNVATSSQFEACIITTEVEFVSADWGSSNDPVDGQVKWSAVEPGSPRDAKSLETSRRYLFITKAKADQVMSLKPGDRVRVTGSTKHEMADQATLYATRVAPVSP